MVQWRDCYVTLTHDDTDVKAEILSTMPAYFAADYFADALLDSAKFLQTFANFARFCSIYFCICGWLNGVTISIGNGR